MLCDIKQSCLFVSKSPSCSNADKVWMQSQVNYIYTGKEVGIQPIVYPQCVLLGRSFLKRSPWTLKLKNNKNANQKLVYYWFLPKMNCANIQWILYQTLTNVTMKTEYAIVTYPGSFCWFQTGRCFPISPLWGQWWFPCFGPVILWSPAGLRHRPVLASSHCHADQGRPHAIHHCQGDSWAVLDCGPHHRGCKKHRGGLGISIKGKYM